MIKRNFNSFAAILLILTLLICTFGCGKDGKKDDKNSPSNHDSQSASKPLVNPLTGANNLRASAAGKRPVAVVVNNVPAARPQWGLCTPDIVVEGLVEAGITRMLWLYSDVDQIPKVGSIRSARHDFIEFAEGFDAIFVHWGGSPYAYDAIANRKIKDIDGKNRAKYFARDTSKKVPKEHTGYTTGEKLKSAISDLSIRSDIKSSYASPLKFNSSTSAYNGGACASIKMSFSGSYNHTFKYNAEDKLYYNYMNQNKMVDSDGKQMAVTNVITLYIPSFKVLNSAGSIDMDLTGGKGVIASNGTYENITWKKGNTPGNMLALYKEDGTALKLNVGKSYIGLVPQNRSSSTVIS
ncbi:MAG: DUF3048 domain-containing protein [Oscillospiraceae bacterium]